MAAYYSSYSGFSYSPYRSVASRKQDAEKHIRAMVSKGVKLSPVKVEGRVIANTFWGKSWCLNLESYRDFAYRLERGRTYVRNGSVIDLQIEEGLIKAQVSGSSIYTIEIKIDRLKPKQWEDFKRKVGTSLTNLLDLMRGKLPENVLKQITDPRDGLFPKSSEIHFNCSCPDIASMCKHVAATLYGVGARLDQSPELFFKLRGADHRELFTSSAVDSLTANADDNTNSLAVDADLASVFGIDLDISGDAPAEVPAQSSSVSAKKPTRLKQLPKPKPKPTAKAKPTAKPRTKPSKPVKKAALNPVVAKPTKKKPAVVKAPPARTKSRPGSKAAPAKAIVTPARKATKKRAGK